MSNDAKSELESDAANLRKLIRRAESGDAAALPALRKMFLDLPSTVELVGGNLAQQVERTLIKAAAGSNLAFGEGLIRKLELMRQELEGPNPTALERLLAERIALCWLSLHETEIRFAQQVSDLSIRQAEFWQNRIDRAHRRYLSAIRTLATVRKLAVVVQVNIARKQVNVAASAPAINPKGTGRNE